MLKRIWLAGALALVAVAATALAMYIAQSRSSAWVLHSREVLRAARLSQALAIDRVAAILAGRLAESPEAAERARAAGAALQERLDQLVELTADRDDQHARAIALRDAAEAWMRDPALPADPAHPRPTFEQLRAGFGSFIEAEEEIYSSSVRRLGLVSHAGIAAIVFEVLLLLAVLRWFRRRTERQARALLRHREALEEQAVELELQMEESRTLAHELERTNRELLDHDRAAGEARTAKSDADRRYRSLIEQSQELIAILDASGQFLYVSTSVLAVLGYESDELLGRSAFDHVHPDDLTLVHLEFERLLRGGVPSVHAEYRYRHRDGGWRRLASIATDHSTDPALGGLVVNSRDVTEERQLEAQLHQAQKMEAVGRLAGGIAHDFNNLLTSIKLNCQLLEQMLEPGVPEREEVREISRAADRASGLTQQLLAFSRKQILQPRLLDLNDAVHDVESMLRRLLGEDVQVSSSLLPLPPIMADPGQLQQVLLNLAVNARDAMPDGGRLALHTEVFELGDGPAPDLAGAEPGTYVQLTVSDTGIGMDEETRARIFEPFFTTKPAGKGTGLGLATVYGIMRQSGGHITVTTEPGAGTTFRLYFPAKRASIVASVQPVAAERYAGSETLLVAEDEPHLRPLLTRVLREHGYTVLEASNGREALELCERERDAIDLIITDVVMPEMSGREFSERLRARGLQTPLLYMSGYTDDEILRRGMLDPVVTFLQKPFATETLLRAVRRALDATPTGEHQAVR